MPSNMRSDYRTEPRRARADDSGRIRPGGETGQSWLEIIAHGLGAYFIGKGILLARQTWNSGRVVDLLKELGSREASTREYTDDDDRTPQD
jgi:hypothetical protein